MFTSRERAHLVTSTSLPQRLRTTLAVVLTLTGIYLYGFPSANAAYAIGILTHVVLGAGLALLLLPGVMRLFRGEPGDGRLGWLLTAIGGALGLALLKTGATLPFRPLVYTHIGVSTLGVVVLVSSWLRRRGTLAGGATTALVRHAVVVLAVAGIGAGTWYTRVVWWRDAYRIVNPTMPPASMQIEGLGSAGPFYPSSVRTPDGRTIKSSFFLESKACGNRGATPTFTTSG